MSNTPNSPNQESSSPKSEQSDDAYASALARMTAIEYEMNEKHQPEVKHFISKKMLIYTIISIIISLLGLIIGHFVIKDKAPPDQSSEETINQLLDTTKDIRDLEN